MDCLLKKAMTNFYLRKTVFSELCHQLMDIIKAYKNLMSSFGPSVFLLLTQIFAHFTYALYFSIMEYRKSISKARKEDSFNPWLEDSRNFDEETFGESISSLTEWVKEPFSLLGHLFISFSRLHFLTTYVRNLWFRNVFSYHYLSLFFYIKS